MYSEWVNSLPLSFQAAVIAGSGRGKKLGSPTMNLDLFAVPPHLKEGIYACRALIDGSWESAAMHYGPRPVFKDSTSCEVHLIDRAIVMAPELLEVQVVAFLRDVRDFASVEELQAQIAQDIEQTRAILGAQ